MLRSLLLSIALLVCYFVSASGQSVLETTAKDRRSVNITVYNSNIGLVRETRILNLPGGRFALRFADVAAQIRPETVHLGSAGGGAALKVLEQNYQYDLLNPSKILDKYVGREITLVLRKYENHSEILSPTQATLLSNNNGQVWRIGGQIVINPSNIAEMRFPELPSNLVASPTLMWDLDGGGGSTQTVEASYLTRGMNWQADYVLVVNGDDTRGDLQGWVTLNNQSGARFDNARLQLVAGDVNRVADYAAKDEYSLQKADAERAAAAPAFNEQAFFEYHLYTLDRPTSIGEQETKQLSLLESFGFNVRKQFVLNGKPYYFRSYNNPGAPIKDKVGVFVAFRNSSTNRLGMPLPAGTVRLYKRDAQGGQQFIGEDRIDHTPKDEDVEVKLGDAFDIAAERKQTDYKVLAYNLYEYAYEIKIRNHKDSAIQVVVNEPIGGDWEMLYSSFEAEKTAAFAARFIVPVAKDGEAKLQYRVRVKY